jgi:hypothetical protein
MRWLLLLALLACVFAASQTAPQTPQIKPSQKADSAAKGKEAGKQDEHRAAKSAAIVEAPQTTNAKDECARQSDETTEYWAILGYKGRITDWLLSLFTFFLVAVGAVQGYFLLRTLSATETAAKSAERQSKAAIAVELPIVRVINLKLAEFDDSGKAIEGNDPVAAGDLPGIYHIFLAFKNAGRSIAHVNKISVNHVLAIKLPDEPTYSAWAKLAFDVEQQGNAWYHWFLTSIKLSKDERERLVIGGTNLWVYGFMAFTDFMGDPHESRFVGLWNANQRPPMANGVIFGFGPQQYATNT